MYQFTYNRIFGDELVCSGWTVEVAKTWELVDQDFLYLRKKHNDLQENIDCQLKDAHMLEKSAEEKHDWLDLSKADICGDSTMRKKMLLPN